MLKICAWPLLCVLTLTSTVLAVDVVPDLVPSAVADRQRPLEPDQVRLQGWLGNRLVRTEQTRLLDIEERILLSCFQKRPGNQAWAGEHVGKYLHAATLAWVYTGDPRLREKMDRVVGELLKTQMPDGYLGTYLEQDRWTAWDVWVHKYNLIGLLTYYRYTGHKPSLEACRRIGDLLCDTFGKDKRDIIKAGEHVGMAATSVLEPMVWLYRLTGDKKYLEFCEYILWAWEQPHGPQILSSLREGKGVNQVGNGKAYEMLSNFVGLCELYRTTGRRELLEPVLTAWNDIVARRLYITGSGSQKEFFRDDYHLPNEPESHASENCVTVTWMQLNIQLLRLTGEAKYADELERTAYNQISFSQKEDGSDFAYFSPLQGIKEFGHLGREIHCCLSSGPRGLALLPTVAYTIGDDGIHVNLFETGSATISRDGRKIRVEQETLYPNHGHITVRADAPVRVRVPGWSAGGNATYRKLGQGAAPADARIQGEVTYDVSPRPAIDEKANAGRVAWLRGPLVLAADQGSNPNIGALPDVALPTTPEALAFEAKPVDPREWPGQQVYHVHGCVAGKVTPLKMVPFGEVGRNGTYYQVWFEQADPACFRPQQ